MGSGLGTQRHLETTYFVQRLDKPGRGHFTPSADWLLDSSQSHHSPVSRTRSLCTYMRTHFG